ncbi:polyprenyl synthetase family protein [Amycolatopsis palatopharyngis]|uniref:polyprenyl synthetase family protein n=1 Tax=Amycolatopsis palatopharyngis TaxID=187982 RepID=UPI000E24B367|nr:polyprenyl synthetase family protein [Amycolatopsis palatopharyngis]
MSTVLPEASRRDTTTEAPRSAYRELPQTEGLRRLSTLVGTALSKRWASEEGLLGTICHYALVPTGKLFRPMLLLESALAVGGEVGRVLPAAVGAECGHVASLIHDDIIDRDELRRGRSSVQHKFGTSDAIVAGDALIFDLFASLADCREAGVPDDRVVSALAAVARAGLDLCRGQSLESELSRDLRFDAEAYLRVARLKTAAYFRGACESGAIMGGGGREQVARLAAYGDHLGMAFQIHDDLLAYLSDSGSTGKPGTSDLQNARMTLPIILAFDGATGNEREMIRRCMTSAADPQEAMVLVEDLLRRTGAIDSAAAIARDHALRARAALDGLAATASRETLCWVADLVVSRDH